MAAPQRMKRPWIPAGLLLFYAVVGGWSAYSNEKIARGIIAATLALAALGLLRGWRWGRWIAMGWFVLACTFGVPLFAEWQRSGQFSDPRKYLVPIFWFGSWIYIGVASWHARTPKRQPPIDLEVFD